MMKNRVAHILATCLNTDGTTGNEFDLLINEIKEEQIKLSRNRVFYYFPFLILTSVSFVITFFIKDQLKLDTLSLI